MQSRLPDGTKVVLSKAVRIQHVEQTLTASSSVIGLSQRPIVVDWDRRCVFVERKPDRWIWIPFEHIAWSESDALPAPMSGPAPVAEPKRKPKAA